MAPPAGGTLTAGGLRGDVLIDAGAVYLRGDEPFWSALGVSGSPPPPGWVILPPDFLGESIRQSAGVDGGAATHRSRAARRPHLLQRSWQRLGRCRRQWHHPFQCRRRFGGRPLSPGARRGYACAAIRCRPRPRGAAGARSWGQLDAERTSPGSDRQSISYDDVYHSNP